jgi:hypothetical protein
MRMAMLSLRRWGLVATTVARPDRTLGNGEDNRFIGSAYDISDNAADRNSYPLSTKAVPSDRDLRANCGARGKDCLNIEWTATMSFGHGKPGLRWQARRHEREQQIGYI